MEPFDSSKKNIRALIALTTIALITWGCKTNQKSTEASVTAPLNPAPILKAPISAGLTEEIWKQSVTKSGTNDKPAFSKDAKKLFFISKDRSLHKNRQVYEINLDTQVEKRISYQDGDILDVAISEEDGSLFYASTTDSIKERPVLLYPELKNPTWPLTDIYRIFSLREAHERWTDFPTYEGFIHVFSEGVVASRLVNEDLHLIKSSYSKANFETLAKKTGSHLHSYTTFKKWRAWIEEERESNQSSISIVQKGQKATLIKLNLVEARDLQVIDTGKGGVAKNTLEILFSAKSLKGSFRQSYWLRLSDNCLQKFMPSEGTVSDLRLSPDQKLIAWTLSHQNRSQIFLSPLMAPTGACEPSGPTGPLE